MEALNFQVVGKIPLANSSMPVITTRITSTSAFSKGWVTLRRNVSLNVTFHANISAPLDRSLIIFTTTLLQVLKQ